MGFQGALEFSLRHEGGFVDHPADHGGPTNKGITQAVYHDYLKKKGEPIRSVKEISFTDIHEIYRERYWMEAKCFVLPERLGIVHFDSAVQHGVTRAIKFLQNALRIQSDGIWGLITHTAVVNCYEKDIIEKYLFDRQTFYTQIVAHDENQAIFLRGWLNRLRDLRTLVQ